MKSIEPKYKRTPVHTRHITCVGYLREDGLWDVDGRLTDTKPYTLAMPERGIIPPGEYIHDMTLRISFDRDMVIREVSAHMEMTPWGACPEIEAAYQKLVGMRIEHGFSLRVKGIFRGIAGCSHLTELIAPIATTAFQAVWSPRPMGEEYTELQQSLNESESTSPIGGCHALKKHGSVVKIFYPDLYEPNDT